MGLPGRMATVRARARNVFRLCCSALLVGGRHAVDDDLAEFGAVAKRHRKGDVGDGVLLIDLRLRSAHRPGRIQSAGRN